MRLSLPPRLAFVHAPTPLQPLARVGGAGPGELWIKRDDLTESAMAGNKARKLEFLVGEALEQGCDTLVTCGAVTSNHARATAVAAARCGLRAHLLLRGEVPARPEGNVLLDRLLGAGLTTIAPAAWPQRAARMAGLAADLAGEGRKAYVIPEGGSNALGSLGYAVAARELLEQADMMGLRVDSIVHAAGSGGTTAGLALGLAGLGAEDIDLVGVAVCDDAETFEATIQRIHAEAVARGFVTREVRARARWRILDGYQGAGYARTSPPEMEFLADVARREGVVLDPVYTGKAFRALCEERRDGRLGGAGATVFLHTGGIFGLYHFADAVARLP